MKKLVILFLLTLLIFSCSPTTKITGSWKNPKETSKIYDNIFIDVMTGNNIVRSTLENEMEKALKASGVTTGKKMDEFPPTLSRDSIPRDVMVQTMKKKGSQAILTVTLLKKETETRYVRGGYAPMSRFGYYNNYLGYYNYWHPYSYSPGYYTKDEIYYLETNLYDINTETLIWSAQSETYSYDGLKYYAKEFAQIMTAQMKADGVIKKGTDKTVATIDGY